VTESANIVIGTRHAELRKASFADVKAAFALGWADLKAAPLHGMAIGLFYALGGLLISYIAFRLGYWFMAAPMAAGFTLLGPFATIGLYQISRMRENGDKVTWQGVRASLTTDVKRECAYLGFLLFVLFAMWIESIFVLYALFFGMNILSFPAFLEAALTTPAGISFLVAGHILGGCLATFVFALSVISFPMIVDRGTDFITALITSIRTVASNPGVMIPWGACIGVLLLVGFATAFLGLIIILPLLGHTSWHIYRRIVIAA
jgi:uncharacterized membrane protein